MARNKATVIWSPEALGDIDQLWEYYAGVAGPATANKVLREIAKVVEAIEAFPFGGRSRNEVRVGLRSLATNPHIVFYRVGGDRTEIVRVLDGRQDVGKIFLDDESS